MREGTCDDCRSWEEELYWKHFQYIHFCQFLHSGFDQRLAIPEKFTKNLIRKLPDIVTLKSPGGAAREVCLTAQDNTLFFNHGWREFVEEHSLEENDILVFKYNGESCFDVLMFNGQSMCEKAGSYFLTKCVHKEQNSTVFQSKRKTRESSVEALSASPEDGNGGSQQEKSTPNIVCAMPLRPVSRIYGGKKALRGIKFKAAISTPKTAGTKEPCDEDVEAKPDIVHPSLSLPGRRSILQEHYFNVLQLAKAAVTSDGFVAVMRPTYVSRKFFMSLPCTWVSKHISFQGNQDVILRIKEKTWQVRLYYRKKPNRGGFACGWRSFVLDNNLQEFDVCVFEPGHPLNSLIVLDVNIFPVVHELSPLTESDLPQTEPGSNAYPDRLGENHTLGQSCL